MPVGPEQAHLSRMYHEDDDWATHIGQGLRDGCAAPAGTNCMCFTDSTTQCCDALQTLSLHHKGHFVAGCRATLRVQRKDCKAAAMPLSMFSRIGCRYAGVPSGHIAACQHMLQICIIGMAGSTDGHGDSCSS